MRNTNSLKLTTNQEQNSKQKAQKSNHANCLNNRWQKNGYIHVGYRVYQESLTRGVSMETMHITKHDR